MSVKLLNFCIWILFALLIICAISIFYSWMKKNRRKSIIGASSLFLGSLVLIVYFYFPTHFSLDDESQLSVTIQHDGRFYELMDNNQKREIKDLVEKQSFVKSTRKTLFSLPPVQADEHINLFIVGTGSPFSMQIAIRTDSKSYSYMNKNDQYYSIYNLDSFMQNITNFISHLKDQ